MSSSRTVPIAAGVVAQARAQGLLQGFSLIETGGTNPVTVNLYDAASATGTKVAVVRLAAGTSQTVAITSGVFLETGLFVELVGTGAVAGSLWIG